MSRLEETLQKETKDIKDRCIDVHKRGYGGEISREDLAHCLHFYYVYKDLNNGMIPDNSEIYRFLWFLSRTLTVSNDGKKYLTNENIKAYLDDQATNYAKYSFLPNDVFTHDPPIKRTARYQFMKEYPELYKQDGSAQKEYVTYKSHRYVVKKEKNKKCIVSKGKTLYLSDIRGQYKKCD